jgi:hypothetical protein
VSLYRSVRIGSLEVPETSSGPVAAIRTARSVPSAWSRGRISACTELISSEALTRNSERPNSLCARRQRGALRHPALRLGSRRDGQGGRRARAFQAGGRGHQLRLPRAQGREDRAGSALLKNPPLLARIVETVRRASEERLGGVPVTVKIRSGWDEGSIKTTAKRRGPLRATEAAACGPPRPHQGPGLRGGGRLVAHRGSGRRLTRSRDRFGRPLLGRGRRTYAARDGLRRRHVRPRRHG